MTALDFFLYDNRTLSPRWGRDWGLKAATGALAERTDLKSCFDRYCGAMPGEQGQLSGFGEAIGGLRSPARDGYLLCVTLESTDSFGRPSWAVFGLWCPNLATLEHVLSSGDPISSARAVLGNETLPSAIEIRPASAAVRLRRRKRASTDPVFHRFNPKSTTREVISLLLGAVQRGTALPNVLGITATARLAAVTQAGFNVVYCHPLDERAERVLVRVLSPPEPDEEEPPSIPVEEPATPPVARPHVAPLTIEPARREPRSSILPTLSLGLLLGIAAMAGFLLVTELWRPVTNTSEPSPPAEEEILTSDETPAPEAANPEALSNEAVLEEIGERLQECKDLAPEELRRSSGFRAAETLEVLPEFQERRERVRKAYSNLIKIRNRMVKRQQGNYVAYYYDDAGKATEAATKLQKIVEILGEAPIGSEDCKILKEAFGFEFENEDSVVRRWCDSLAKLEKTVSRSLSAPDKVQGRGDS